MTLHTPSNSPAFSRGTSQASAKTVDSSQAEKAPFSTLNCQDLSVFYGEEQVVFNVGFVASKGDILALIGPSGSGKSTVLRALNRMHEANAECRVKGSVSFDGHDIYSKESDVVAARMKVGMVFQKPNPYPRSIFENIAYGLRIHGKASCRSEEYFIAEKSLREVGLWRELNGRLEQSAMTLSLGQQQRLCIARTLAINPSVILMDEPCASLDSIATANIEHLIQELGSRMTIVMVSPCLLQTARISTRSAFIFRGRLVEVGPTEKMFSSPRDALTKQYLSGCAIRSFEEYQHA